MEIDVLAFSIYLYAFFKDNGSLPLMQFHNVFHRLIFISDTVD